MDYETRATNRNELRLLAKFFRTICGFTQDEPIDPVDLLDRLPDFENFDDVYYDVVEDSKLPKQVPAQCTLTEDGYLIEIKDSVYRGARERNVGGYRMHIMHEIMHVFADKIGFKPILTRKLSGKTEAYRSIEWIVKALAGEVMMPYSASEGMTIDEIMNTYGVSKIAANERLKYQK